MKLYYKDKIKIIEMYERGVSQKAIAMQFDVGLTIIKEIIRLYRNHGKNILKDKTNNNKYSAEFKLGLVQRVISGESKTSIGVEYGINAGTIHSWCKKYDELGYNGLKQDLRGRPMKKKPKTSAPTKEVTNEDKVKLLE